MSDSLKSAIDGLDLNATKNSLASIDGKLSTSDSDFSITSMVNSYVKEFENFKDNIFAQYNVLDNDVVTTKGLLSLGFVNNIQVSPVTTCPYVRDFYISSSYSVPVSIDFCAVFSPYHSTTYYLFFIVFFASMVRLVFTILSSSRI